MLDNCFGMSIKLRCNASRSAMANMSRVTYCDLNESIAVRTAAISTGANIESREARTLSIINAHTIRGAGQQQVSTKAQHAVINGQLIASYSSRVLSPDPLGLLKRDVASIKAHVALNKTDWRGIAPAHVAVQIYM